MVGYQNGHGLLTIGGGRIYVHLGLQSLYFLDYPIGINIGKNKITAQERAIDDYKILLEKLETLGHILL